MIIISFRRISTGVVVTTLLAHTAPVRALCYSASFGGRLFSAGDDGRLCEWRFPFVTVAETENLSDVSGKYIFEKYWDVFLFLLIILTNSKSLRRSLLKRQLTRTS